jgi:hypothetical protein
MHLSTMGNARGTSVAQFSQQQRNDPGLPSSRPKTNWTYIKSVTVEMYTETDELQFWS